jgi:hypothetical protein
MFIPPSTAEKAMARIINAKITRPLAETRFIATGAILPPLEKNLPTKVPNIEKPIFLSTTQIDIEKCSNIETKSINYAV